MNNFNILIYFFLIFFLPLTAVCKMQDDNIKFVYLKSSIVNMRSGPGKIYPIKWIYQIKGMPMVVLDKFDDWFYVQDIDGDIGWIFHAMIVEKSCKALIIKNGNIKKKCNKKSRIIAKIDYLSLVKIKKCSNDFCLIEASSVKGWIDKNILWGVHNIFNKY